MSDPTRDLLLKCRQYLTECFESDGADLEAEGSKDAKALVAEIDAAMSAKNGAALTAFLSIIPDDKAPKGSKRGSIRFGDASVMHDSRGQLHIYDRGDRWNPLDFEEVVAVEIRAAAPPLTENEIASIPGGIR